MKLKYVSLRFKIVYIFFNISLIKHYYFFIDSSWNQTNTFEDQNKRHHDEELTSMLQRYLDHPENLNDFHQKSPGQQSSDSGFSSSDSKSLPQLDFEDSSEDLSQLVDQVLSSIETQFPEYLHYVDHQIR